MLDLDMTILGQEWSGIVTFFDLIESLQFIKLMLLILDVNIAIYLWRNIVRREQRSVFYSFEIYNYYLQGSGIIFEWIEDLLHG